jgi:cytochrome c oxidase subunit 4
MMSTRAYTGIYAALLGLALLSWWLAYHLDASDGVHLAVALAIAVTKAIMIGAIFMNLRKSHSLNRVFAAAGVFWLAILFTLSLNDYLTRHWLEMPGNWPQDISVK